jgi:hypothetical protein
MAQPQSRIARNGALALHDLADPVRRNLDLPRERAGGLAKLRKLVAQNFNVRDRMAGHGLILNVNLLFQRWTGRLPYQSDRHDQDPFRSEPEC